MLPLAEVYEYAYWCAYICSRWRELAAVRLAEGGHGARLGRFTGSHSRRNFSVGIIPE